MPNMTAVHTPFIDDCRMPRPTYGMANLLNPQPYTPAYTVKPRIQHHVVFVYSFYWCSVHLSTQGWPGWVDLGLASWRYSIKQASHHLCSLWSLSFIINTNNWWHQFMHGFRNQLGHIPTISIHISAHQTNHFKTRIIGSNNVYQQHTARIIKPLQLQGRKSQTLRQQKYWNLAENCSS